MTREEKYLKEMTRKDFYQKIVTGVARTTAFGALVSFGAAYLSDREKDVLVEEFGKISPQLAGDKADMVWDDIANSIIDRAGNLL